MDIILPLVKRVHGSHHPEIYTIGDCYRQIQSGDLTSPDAFQRIRTTTDQYTVPSDVCETHVEGYYLLKQWNGLTKV